MFEAMLSLLFDYTPSEQLPYMTLQYDVCLLRRSCQIQSQFCGKFSTHFMQLVFYPRAFVMQRQTMRKNYNNK